MLIDSSAFSKKGETVCSSLYLSIQIKFIRSLPPAHREYNVIVGIGSVVWRHSEFGRTHSSWPRKGKGSEPTPGTLQTALWLWLKAASVGRAWSGPVEMGSCLKISPNLTLLLIHCKILPLQSQTSAPACHCLQTWLIVRSWISVLILYKTFWMWMFIFFKRIILGHFPDEHLAFSEFPRGKICKGSAGIIAFINSLFYV